VWVFPPKWAAGKTGEAADMQFWQPSCTGGGSHTRQEQGKDLPLHRWGGVQQP